MGKVCCSTEPGTNGRGSRAGGLGAFQSSAAGSSRVAAYRVGVTAQVLIAHTWRTERKEFTVMERNAPTPDMFEAVVTAFADTLIRSYRERWNRGGSEPVTVPNVPVVSPWLRVEEAAKRAQCGEKLLYSEVRAGRLRAVRVGGRRSLRFRAEWIDVAGRRKTPDMSLLAGFGLDVVAGIWLTLRA